MTKIIYIKPSDSSFILTDQKILEKKYLVIPYLVKIDKAPLKFLWAMTKLFFYLLFNARKADMLVTWFADYHAMVVSFIGKLFKKKVVVFIGGMEAIHYPELHKGVFVKKYRGWCVKYAMRNAGLIVSNHESLIYHENYYYDEKGKKDGIKYYFPDLKTKIEVVYNGYDFEFFRRDYSIPKNPNMVLSIGKTNTIYDVINKGFDLLVELARRNPQTEFVIIGVKKSHIDWMNVQYKISDLKNLSIHSFLKQTELFKYFNMAKVFIQASITEGMPNTLAESMLFECVPIGSKVNGIPDTIGDTGIIVNRRSVDELDKALHVALTMNTGKEAREYIISKFSLGQRSEKLIEIFQEYAVNE